MSWLDAAVPVRMKRVALVTLDESLRDVLVRVAAAAAVEIGPAGGEAGPMDPSPSRRERPARRRAGCDIAGIRWPMRPCLPHSLILTRLSRRVGTT